jgi:FtsH-binding integral membrane protein
MISNISLPKEDVKGLSVTDSQMKTARVFSITLLLTGIFAAIGALYRWGDGPIHTAPLGADLEIYVAELVIAAPISILASVGIKKMKRWGMLLALLAVGVYIYGSVLVYAAVFLAGSPYPLKLIIPPVFGITLSISLIYWIWKHFDDFQ